METDTPDGKITVEEGFLQTVLDLSKCPICYLLIKDPETWCSNGHIICQECKGQLRTPECPICKAQHEEKAIKNIVVRQTLEQMQLICAQCDEKIQLLSQAQHQVHCPGRPLPCFGSKEFLYFHALYPIQAQPCLFETNKPDTLIAHVCDLKHAAFEPEHKTIFFNPRTGLFNEHSPHI